MYLVLNRVLCLFFSLLCFLLLRVYIYPLHGSSSPYKQKKSCFLFYVEHIKNKTKSIMY